MVIFGAGKIGRSFIGQLFSRGGYEVVFIDIDKYLIEELNRRGSYRVVIKDEGEGELIEVRNVRGVYAGDRESVIREVASAGILGINVGIRGLPKIFPVIAEGVTLRYESDPGLSLDIIIAENMRDSDAYFRSSLRPLLPENYPVDRLLGFVETSIGKMVPIMLKNDVEEDPLQIFAEKYNTLILNALAFRNPIPQVEGLAPKRHMKAWVDRKLFIHNLGHAVAAYTGHQFFPERIYMYEVLADAEVLDITKAAMKQASSILLLKYPDEFSRKDLNKHIEDLLMRFQNRALGDTVFRIGCDLPRKLGPEDRLAGAIRAAIELDLPYEKILFGIVRACRFRATDEEGNMLPRDISLLELYEEGIDTILQKICGFNRENNPILFRDAIAIDQNMQVLFPKNRNNESF